MKTVAFNYEKDASANFYIEEFADLLGLQVVSEPVSGYRDERHVLSN
jgi:hypothetical protein